MRVEQEKVRAFMEHIADTVNETAVIVDADVAHRRYDLIAEELHEYVAANDAGDLVGVADALGDVLYTVLGAFNLHGMDARAIFEEIHRSNMTKDPAPTNTFKKAVKGERFTKPDLAAVLLVAKLDLDVDIR